MEQDARPCGLCDCYPCRCGEARRRLRRTFSARGGWVKLICGEFRVCIPPHSSVTIEFPCDNVPIRAPRWTHPPEIP